MKQVLVFLGPGALFGIGLAISGMTNPEKVIGFLDIGGEWDASLAFVMAGAIAAFFALRKLAERRGRPILSGEFPPPPAKGPIDGRLIAGAAIFGAGWGLAGFCPGPAIANLGALRAESLWFVPAMVIGMLAARQLFQADR